MKRFFQLFTGALVLLIGVLVYRTLTLPAPDYSTAPFEENLFVTEELAAELSAALQFETISWEVGRTEDEAFRQFYTWMKATYPAVAALPHEAFSWSRLYKWEGTNPDLRPVVLMGHIDVVPIIPGTESQWAHPPFSGAIESEWLYGRGAVDMKGPTVMMLHAINAKRQSGFTPDRTIYIAVHHDEELGGTTGAAKIVEWMQAENIKPIFALDEGGAITEGMMPGMNTPVATIGIAEKGYMSVKVTAPGTGGHSSMPPDKTAIGTLARSIVAIEEHPFAAKLDPPASAMMGHLAPHMGFGIRMMAANMWLFEPVLRVGLQGDPVGNATMRTTIAPTMLQGSVKDNVLPIEASAIINLRIHPHDTHEGALEHLREAIPYPEVTVEPTMPDRFNIPLVISPTEGKPWQHITQAIAEVWPETIIAPYLTVAGTDSKHYSQICENVYRYGPFTLNAENRNGFHGTNERILLSDLVPMATFFWRVVDHTHAADSFAE